jgi:hypothetical protein
MFVSPLHTWLIVSIRAFPRVSNEASQSRIFGKNEKNIFNSFQSHLLIFSRSEKLDRLCEYIHVSTTCVSIGQFKGGRR